MFSGSSVYKTLARSQGQMRAYSSALMRSGFSSAREERLKSIRKSKEKPQGVTPAQSLADPIDIATATEIRPPSKEIGLVRSTTLDNGVRLISRPNGLPAAGVGAFIKGGSDEEFGIPSMMGCAHLCEKLAFKSSAAFPHEETLPYFEEIGALGYGYAAKEDIKFCMEAPVDELPKVAEIVMDTTVNTRFRAEEVEEQKELAHYFVSEEYNLTPDMWMPEEAHYVAYRDSPLGHKSIPTVETIASLQPSTIEEFKRKLVVPEKLVFATTGIDHEEFVEIAKKTVGHLQRSGNVAINKNGRREDLYYVPDKESPYIGGYATLEDTRLEFFKANKRTPPEDFKDHGSVVVAFEGACLTDIQDYYSMCILQSLMGSGASFSSGGPGKGMYTRSYQNILNHYYVDNVFCFAMSYNTTGLFGLYLSGEQNQLSDMLSLACINLAQMATIEDEELQRAKNQLKAALFSRLETRSIQLEDLGLQKLVNDDYTDCQEHLPLIDSVTKEQLQDFATRMLRTTPTVVLHGRKEELEKAHKMHEIQMFFVRNFGAEKTSYNK